MDKLEEALEFYERTFEESFPTIPLLMDNSDEDVIRMINKCVSQNKDVYGMGFLDEKAIY